MKKNLFMVAAVALMALVSCNKEEINNNDIINDEQIETPSDIVFVAEFDQEPDTKIALGDVVDGVRKTTWVAGDKIMINGTEFTAKETGERAEFATSSSFDEADEYFALYPSTISGSKTGVKIPNTQDGSFETASISVAKSSNTSLQFKNIPSILKFQVPVECSTITVSATDKSIVGIVDLKYNEDGTINVGPGLAQGSDKVTLSGSFVPEKDYFVAVAPGKYKLTISIDDEVSKASTKDVTLVRSKIHNLGVLPDPKDTYAASYGLVGSFQTPTTWDVANPVAMEYVSDGWIVAKNVELYKNDEFKFAKDKSWTVSYGTSTVTVLEEGKETTVVTTNSQNMKVSKNGKYNLYLNPNAKKVKVECVEEYTDLKVNITIDNKANWSPLAITLKEGTTVIADKATVTGNKYSISGDYIGSTLTCQFFSGSKQSAVMNVAITKNGATVTLEETVIKLKVQLNTANAKQWWGNTMKIHVWETGTSFDTSWPGNTMTSEGNYTWSIIVPSELVGKTIKYLVHNGNGWQSKDATVTISAAGNTVTGTSIGIN